MTFTLAPELAGIVRPGVLWLRGATVVERQPLLDAPIAETERALRTMLSAAFPSEGGTHPVRPAEAGSHVPDGPTDRGVRLEPDDLRRTIDLVRTMYKRVGIDPTRRRPSSEALLRRVLKGDALPRINSVVDICNWCSFEFQLPYGLYDAQRISGDVTLRAGTPGESYPGIRKDDVHVGGRITLADAAGPFGNPTSDSARTMVTGATTDILLVVYAPDEFPYEHLNDVLDLTGRRMHRYAGAVAEAVPLSV